MRVSARRGGSGHVNLPSHFGWLVQAHVYKYSAYYQYLREANQNEQLDSFQRDLSYIGVFPVVGNAVNVVNGVISLYRGNYVDAAVNFVSALPVVGTAFGGAKLAVKGGAKLLTQFSSSTIDDAVAYAMKNKVTHVFGKEAHNLDPLVTKLGGYENTFRAVLNAANGKLPSSGVFNNISVNVGGYNVMIRGSVVNGVPKIGTMFIP